MSDRLANVRVALFVPCYVDQLAPQVAFASLRVLARFGVKASFVSDPACCGQPMANVGSADEARPLALSFLRSFAGFDYVVCPSGSCVSMVRNHYRGLVPDAAGLEICGRTMELCEFLSDVVGVDRIGGRFPHRVGLHKSCHGLRGLRLGSASELVETRPDPVGELLASIEGLQLVSLERADECCGFGGAFAVEESGVSTMMGRDRVDDHVRAGAEVIASIDMSCLLHLQGLMRRRSVGVRAMHVAEIFDACGGDA